jgi:hypothetical protein
MSERETAGAIWFKKEKERRAREAADKERSALEKRATKIEEQRIERLRKLENLPSVIEEFTPERRAMVERIIAESQQRSNERTEAALRRHQQRSERLARRKAEISAHNAAFPFDAKATILIARKLGRQLTYPQAIDVASKAVGIALERGADPRSVAEDLIARFDEWHR